MSRRRTLTSRSERERDRQEQHLRHTLHDTNQVNNNSLLVTIVDSYKTAMNDIPANFSVHDCGLIDTICKNYKAKHFVCEVIAGND